jgi:hypothetical protein
VRFFTLSEYKKEKILQVIRVCRVGWFSENTIEDMKIDTKLPVGKGWWDIVIDIVDLLKEQGQPFLITCIKEKYGVLNVNYQFESVDGIDMQNLYETIARLEGKSKKTCEGCGSANIAGQPKGEVWIKTLCKKCWMRRMGKAYKTYKAT